MKYVTLNTGTTMPIMGFGVFQVTDLAECKRVVLDAIDAGYRLFDTAAVYGNETAVGEAIAEAIAAGKVTREELFITSKLWVQDMNESDAVAGVERSLKNLGLEYLDLYLLHQALGDYFGAWRTLEKYYETGHLKAIGVSNFYPNMLTNFCETVKVIPAVNQIELHPFFTQDDALETMKYYGVIPEAWAPLGGGRYNPLDNELLQGIAEKYGKTVGQVVLRWNLQRDVVVIPKTTRKERMVENFDVWDFELSQEDMDTISSLDMGYGGTRTKHFDPEYVRMIHNVKVHE
ncbi:aldo/keto reductase [Veillonella agrestimuris]|uniref:aldo/keto reductase n=1 Tax=Veillonella agrestimuris TaxID=2941340 RepID=UPI00203C1E15|nr:aldo/keto reductase [Veillonella agrestimuris]